jgi:hypothetical protein
MKGAGRRGQGGRQGDIVGRKPIHNYVMINYIYIIQLNI